ncbi:hypothetical protein WA158_008319 [Blastocystis sp. Blastoise]
MNNMNLKEFFEQSNWKDFEPEPLEEIFTNICPIQYTRDFLLLTSYFKGILRDKEFSERAYQLTYLVIKIDPSNYSAWIHRQKCMDKLNIPLESDFALCDSVIQKNIKNYQAWMHRRYIVSHTNKYEQELEYTKNILKKDAKNMHAWQQRQYINETFDQWDEELEYTASLLAEDIRNNSAWVHRYNTIQHLYSIQKDESILKEEIAYIKISLQITMHNTSIWTYIRGFIRDYSTPSITSLENWILVLSNAIHENEYCLLTCADIYIKRQQPERAIEMYTQLQNVCPFRNQLWTNLISNLQH